MYGLEIAQNTCALSSEIVILLPKETGYVLKARGSSAAAQQVVCVVGSLFHTTRVQPSKNKCCLRRKPEESCVGCRRFAPQASIFEKVYAPRHHRTTDVVR